MGETILLIEDEANIAEALSFILGREGWQAQVHADGATAFARVRAVRPAAVILDVMLPGRSGYEILEEMRADPEFAALPVLLLTARGQERERALAAARGASLFMTKPFSNSELVANLRRLLAARG